MKDINFEKALEQLEKIVEKLETGDLPLDAMLKKYEEGVKLAALCQEKLDKAKERIETLVKQGDGSFKKTVFDDKE